MNRSSDCVNRRKGSIVDLMAGLIQGAPKAERSDAVANRQHILEAAREVFARRGLDAEIKELADRIEQPDNDAAQARQLLADLLQRGMADRVFRSDLDIAVATATLESIFRSGAFLELAAQRSCPAAADAVADFFLHAVGAPTSSAST